MTKHDPYNCPCVRAERCTCGRGDCWHFGGQRPCAHCNNTGRAQRIVTRNSDAIRRFVAAADAIAWPKPHARRARLYADYENAKRELNLK